MKKETAFLILGWIAIIFELISLLLILIHEIFLGFTMLFAVIAITCFVFNMVNFKEDRTEEAQEK